MLPQPEATLRAPRSAPVRRVGPWRVQFEMLAVIGLMSLPAFSGAAKVLRPGFPVLTLAFAAFLLMRGDYRRYVSFCLWLFLLTPEVRRLVDLRAGWVEPNMLMLAPYLCGALSLGTLAFALTSPRHPISLGLVLMAFASLYGFLISPISGTFLAGGYDFLRFIIPPCFGLAIAMNVGSHDILRADLRALLVLSLTLVGGYAIYQFWYLPSWDATWMENAKMESIGSPEPFKVRSFSTLNSPGSLAIFLMIALTMTIGTRGWLRWPAMAIGTFALSLTVVRAAWIGMALVFFFYVLAAPARTRGSVVLLCIAGVFAAPFVLVNEQANELITQRLSTLTNLSADQSANDRLAAYRSLGDDLQSSLLGKGLGTTGSYQSASGEGNATVVDGGPIEIILKIGLLGAFVYYAGVLVLMVQLFFPVLRNRPRDGDFLAACRAVALTGIVLQASSPSTVGEMGLFMWLAVGFGLASIQRSDARMAAAPAAPDTARAATA
ncbi:O-antigen ligase family protein [Pararhizobium mangrovi]|uniref:O-antigen ligase domain-containing protein n=1 Tax=Pararhizobium mangrovi TaxID=2590452 RepID=A0A506U4F4_9HYPH|nr:hypothetical protein [Pararhizobium mangrovi]TPW27924.1 hypothetical protein FJU11_10290 [Pararhizobium mangrovi]